jgi:phosphoribosyl-dephospho-CoA transferase
MQSIYENIPGLNIIIVDELKREVRTGYEFMVRTQLDNEDKQVGYLVEIDVMRANHEFPISREHFEFLKAEYSVPEGPRLCKR